MEFYRRLEIEPTATQEEIKRAYRKLILKYHPDRNLTSETSSNKFIEIHEAYQVLSDPNQRKYYDLSGKSPRFHLFTERLNQESRERKKGNLTSYFTPK